MAYKYGKNSKGCVLPKGKTEVVQSRTTTPKAQTKPDALQPHQTYKSTPKSKVKPDSIKPPTAGG